MGSLSGAMAVAQNAQPVPAAHYSQQLQQRLQQISVELAATQQRLAESQQELLRLQQELLTIQSQLAGATPQTATNIAQSASAAPATASATPQENSEKIDVLEAQVKLHDQTKVESASKYPVRFTGLVLFNTFVDQGGVDNLDLPSLASKPATGTSSVATGMSIRQTILGVQARGPHVFGAATSGEVNMDFYGGIPYSNYNTVAGIVRLRTAAIRMDWERDSVEAGFVAPLISPLEPTSYATVAEPAMSWAGNLWTWAPQIAYRHSFASSSDRQMAWQFGLWDPPAAGYNADELFRPSSAGERSGQPAYETRFSYADGKKSNGLQLGLGAYYSRQSYTGRSGDSWAVTEDWRLPLGRVFELSGEAYRGRALGGLGGGVYKDVVIGNDPITGAATFRLLNTGGGWLQTKFHLTRSLEANAADGLDDGFARDFHSLVIPAGTSGTAVRARNRMFTTNLIYSPKTYLIFSPEYRRIWTWSITGAPSIANITTMTFGLRF